MNTEFPAPIHIRLLGQFSVSDIDQIELNISAKKSQALLAFLAMNSDAGQSRDRLANLLWGETGDIQARTSLRQALKTLRKSLNHQISPTLLNKGNNIQLDISWIRVDALEYDQLCIQGTISALEKADTLYNGDFLDSFNVNELAFDEWMSGERRRLQERQLRTLRKLLEYFRQSNNTNRTIDYAGKLLLIDPLQEDVHRVLIQSYCDQDRRRTALQQYHTCREVLLQDLGIEPDEKTNELIKNLLGTKEPSDKLQDAVSNNKPFQHKTINLTNIAPRSLVGDWKIVAAVSVVLFSVAITSGFLLKKELYISDNIDSGDSAVGSNVNHSIDRPSIAVLPFENLSNDPERIYFSDGLTDDLIIDLSRNKALRVISSRSSFAFRDSAQNYKQISDILGITHLLTGSVRTENNDIRVNVKLMETKGGSYIWTDQFATNSASIFNIQDRVTTQVARALAVELHQGNDEKRSNKRYVNPDAYDLLLRGLHPLRQFSVDSLKVARQYFSEAIALDPNYARAHANLALSYGREIVFRLARNDMENIKLGLQEADRAEAIDPEIPQTQFARGVLNLAAQNHTAALEASRRAVQLDPNYADGYAVLAQTSVYSGNLNDALEAIGTAKELNPIFPFGYLWVEAHTLYLLERYEEAIPLLEEVLQRNPEFFVALTLLSATYGQLDLLGDAEWINEEIYTLNSEFSSTKESIDAPYRFKIHREHYLSGMLKSGLPE